MRRNLQVVVVLTGLAVALTASVPARSQTASEDTRSGGAPRVAAGPARKPRAKSFLGIHFDFHAGDDCTEIGKNTTRRMIENVIDQVHPDYLQIDCKGHPGLSSYPTKVGNPAPGFVGDPLRLWREVTAERGVALYMHYSGVWDSEAIRKHPTWGAVNADGSINPNATSFFSPYADELMIPQLRELAGDYGVDGAWVDGECWASVPDYSAVALAAFRRDTGLTDVPRSPSEPHWFEFLDFHREAFRKHLRHYLAALHATHPAFELCSNWAFSDHMPERVCAPVAWISGDLTPLDSVNSARISARFLARQGKTWDLMAWSFAEPAGGGRSGQKTAVQLEREAALVLTQGGGFSAYFTQRRDGSIREEQLPVMAEVARFCRDRQALCHKAELVPQIAVLDSTADHYRAVDGLFPRDLSRFRGTLQALVESQQVVELVGEHQIEGRMKAYPLIVIPECTSLEPSFRAELVDYVRDGGNLLLVGPRTALLFRDDLGATLASDPQARLAWLAHQGQRVPTAGLVAEARLESSTEPFGTLQASESDASPATPAASIHRLGKGRIAATYFDFSHAYATRRNTTARAFLNDLARTLFPEPIVELSGSHDVDVVVARKNGWLLVNLINAAGPHDDPKAAILDTIPPVGPLDLRVRAERSPERVMREPGSQALPFEYSLGQVRLTVPRLEIHSAIVID